MYTLLKQLVKKVLPSDILIKNEYLIRKAFSFFYKGSDFECNFCKKNYSKFINHNNDLLCPGCGSSSRTRRLKMFLESEELLKGNILHFSPNRIEYKTYKKEVENYTTSDFENEFIADEKYDLTNLPDLDNHFDLIICYHILEHIVDDVKAMNELKRVVKETGKVLIQTPYKEGETYEDYSVTSPEDRLKHFGQDDHIRIYSCEGLKARLESTGFKCTVIDMANINSDKIKRFGLDNEEKFILAEK
ncbi:MAG: methyltransferase domain-containing protein [Rhodothermaceae bacterium]